MLWRETGDFRQQTVCPGGLSRVILVKKGRRLLGRCRAEDVDGLNYIRARPMYLCKDVWVFDFCKSEEQVVDDSHSLVEESGD